MDVFIRSAKTFLETAAGAVVVAVGAGIDINDRTALLGLALSAIAAGLSAVLNISINIVVGGAEK